MPRPSSQDRVVCNAYSTWTTDERLTGWESKVYIRPGRRGTPRRQYVVRDLAKADTVQHLGEDKRPVAAHPARVAFHDAEVRTHERGQVGLVDDQQIGLRDARPALARYLVPT